MPILSNRLSINKNTGNIIMEIGTNNIIKLMIDSKNVSVNINGFASIFSLVIGRNSSTDYANYYHNLF